MMRGSNHGRHLQSATFRGCVGCSSSTCNSPVCSLGCTARPQSPQRKTATARQRMIGAFGCHHQPSLRDAPGQRPSRAPPGHPVLRNHTMITILADLDLTVTTFEDLIVKTDTLICDRICSLTIRDHTAAREGQNREWAARPDLLVVSPGLRRWFICSAHREMFPKSRQGWVVFGSLTWLTRGAESFPKLPEGNGQALNGDMRCVVRGLPSGGQASGEIAFGQTTRATVLAVRNLCVVVRGEGSPSALSVPSYWN
ncbi:hypothetical protein GEV33_001175 [Tenebrio molitor]|uniref:Uncharacterized protein n=1 Tax=Tenebrio molitor TaxID=7067 RepID=A0A8J6LQF7_TENMO|nr:hypothetical protein GEV33_001175 [Tenebrio molitor]